MRSKIFLAIVTYSAFFLGNPLKGQITGPTLVNYESTSQYIEPTVTGYPYDYTYFFTAVGGTLVSGQTQTSVSIIWNNAANGTVQKWKSSTHAYSIVLIQSLDVTVQNTPATSYLYDNAGNRTKRQVIILNPSTLKSGHLNGTEDTINNNEIERKIFEENLDKLSIKIYPNPTTGRLLVNLTGIDQTFPSSISIISTNGIVINKISPASDSNEIDLSHNADGVYILVISANDKSTEWKVVKQ